VSYFGDVRLGDTIDVKFTTRRFSTGAPFTLAGSPAISAYVGNGTTEITAGITLTVDFDSRTGLNNVRVVATSGNGFATATNVQLVITAGTVDSVSVVGEVVGSFSIEARSALMSTTAGRTLVVDAAGLADANTVKVGPTGSGTAQTAGDIPARLPAALVSGRIDASVGAMAADTLTASALATDAVTEINSGQATAASITTLQTDVTAVKAKTDNLPSDPADQSLIIAATDAIYARVGAPAGASVSADVAAVKAQTAAIEVDTQDIQARLPAALVGGKIDASVGALGADSITSSVLAASAITEIQSGLSTAASLTTLQTDVTSVLGRLPTVLVGGRMDSSVGAMVADIITSSVLADSAITEIQNAPIVTEIAAIRAKTDQLTFTVANNVDANVQRVNDVAIQGTGTVGSDEWRKA
jgi:hypothetical protein